MAGIDAGSLDRRVRIERRATTEDDFGGEIETWSELATLWASVNFGQGQERRQAAQESATAPATFRVRWSPVTATITPVDRILFMDAIWDISSAVPFGRNEGIDITATRAA